MKEIVERTGKCFIKTAVWVNLITGVVIVNAYVLGDPAVMSEEMWPGELIRYLCVNAFGPESRVVADCLGLSGQFCCSQWKLGMAAEYFKLSLAIQEKVEGAESPKVAATLNGLAFAQYGMGESSQKLNWMDNGLVEMLLKEKEKSPKNWDEKKEKEWRSYQEQAKETKSKFEQRYQSADEYYVRALAICEKVCARNNDPRNEAYLDLIWVLNNRAVLKQKQRDYEEGEKLYQRALKTAAAISNVSDVILVRLFSNLTEFYISQGKHEKAENFWRKGSKMVEGLVTLTRKNQPAVNDLEKEYDILGSRLYDIESGTGNISPEIDSMPGLYRLSCEPVYVGFYDLNKYPKYRFTLIIFYGITLSWFFLKKTKSDPKGVILHVGMACVSACVIVAGTGFLFWLWPRFPRLLLELGYWVLARELELIRCCFEQWWGRVLALGVVVAFLAYAAQELYNEWCEEGYSDKIRALLAPAQAGRSNNVNDVSKSNDRPVVVTGFNPDLSETLDEITKLGLIEGGLKTQEFKRKRKRAVKILEAEIAASKKRIEYIRTVAEESSVVDEERFRIAKLRQEMKKLEQADARLDLEDKVERKRLEKALEELERDIRVLRTQPEKPSKPPTVEEKRRETLRQEQERHGFNLEMNKMKAKQGLAARRALMAARKEELEEICRSTQYTEEEKQKLIEDVEDYYDNLLERTD